MHVDGPIEKLYERQSIFSHSMLGDHYYADEGKNLWWHVHAQIEPAPDAVMADEVQGRFVKHLILLLHNTFFLTKGADSACASHTLVEIRVNRAPKCWTYFVKLVVGAEIGPAYPCHEVNYENEAKYKIPRAQYCQDWKHDNYMRPDSAYMIECA